MKKPTLVQGAFGTRGRYRTVEVIEYDDTPVGTCWIATKHREVEALGYDRCRIKVWIDYNDHYITV